MLKRLDKFGLIFVPSIMMIGGTVNLYMAYNIFSGYQEDKELINVLINGGVVLDNKSSDEKAIILKEVKEFISQGDQDKLISFIN